MNRTQNNRNLFLCVVVFFFVFFFVFVVVFVFVFVVVFVVVSGCVCCWCEWLCLLLL